MNIKENLKTFFYLHKNKFIVLFIVVISLCFMNIKKPNEEVKITSYIETKEEKSDVKNSCLVDVKGEVKKPGVYELDSDSRVIDALNMAGLTKESNTKFINLSKIISDEMVIFIYSNDEVKKMLESTNVESICDVVHNNACVDSEESIIYDKGMDKVESNLLNKSEEENDNIININTATLEELLTLSGIGESKAKSIIEYRTKTPFNKIEDIMNVSGIGESLYNKIKENITV